jgi:hypothetical protein
VTTRRVLGLATAVAALTAVGGALAAAPTPRARAEQQARVAVTNLVENVRGGECPIVKWRIVSVVQGPFPGIAHPGRGKLLVLVTIDVQWSGTGFFSHRDAFTAVGSKLLPADTNRSAAVYRDREAAWLLGGCLGAPPFG